MAGIAFKDIGASRMLYYMLPFLLTIKGLQVNNRNIGRKVQDSEENEEEAEDHVMETILFYFNCLFPTCMHWLWLMNNYNTKLLNFLYVGIFGPRKDFTSKE